MSTKPIPFALTGGLRLVENHTTPHMRRELWQEPGRVSALEATYETRVVAGVERLCLVQTNTINEES